MKITYTQQTITPKPKRNRTGISGMMNVFYQNASTDEILRTTLLRLAETYQVTFDYLPTDKNFAVFMNDEFLLASSKQRMEEMMEESIHDTFLPYWDTCIQQHL